MKMKLVLSMKFLLLTIFSLSKFFSLSAQENLKAYYFPIDQLETAKVYHYKCSKPVLGDLFWVLKSETNNDSSFLITDSYSLDTTGKVRHIECLTEWINDTAAIVIAYKSYLYTEERNQYYEIVKEQTIEVIGNISSSEVFKWEQKPTETLNFNFSYSLDSATVNHVRKQRNFTNTFDEISFEQNNIKAYIFDDKISIQSEANDIRNSTTFEILRQSFYAKGVGLYKYNQTSMGFDVTYELTDILTIVDWNKILKKQ